MTKIPRRLALFTIALVTPLTLSAAAIATNVEAREGPRVQNEPPFANPVFAAPVTTTECQAVMDRRCYSPTQYARAFNLSSLHRRGITGKGRTIVIVTSFGSPTIRHDLEVFSRQWGLPSPKIDILEWGHVPPFDPNSAVRLEWAHEATLDVAAAHSVAPDAKIILVETDVAETEGLVGIPEMMGAIDHLVESDSADVISMSWATRESRFPGADDHDFRSLLEQRDAFKNAARHGVTLVASSTDAGGHDDVVDAGWPAGDPLVTAVGGTELSLDNDGDRLAPDIAWTGSGGEHSQVFTRPRYQDRVRTVVGSQRGTPDVSMAASPDGALWLYSSFNPEKKGWTADGAGTSESAPLFAGIVALADQAVGHRLGNVNDVLYRLYTEPNSGLTDVTMGQTGPNGFTAGPGYDQASGVGTVDADRFVRTLMH